LRVCILTTSFPRFEGDDAGLFVFHLARALVAAGHEAEAVAPWEAGSATRENMEGIEVHRFRYSPWGRLNLAYGGGGIPEKVKADKRILSVLPIFTLSFLARSAAVAQRCDVIHAHWLYSGLVAGILRKTMGVPAVLTLRGSDVKYLRNSRFLAPTAKLAFAMVDRVTAVSADLKDSALHLGCRQNRIETIFNGVDFSLFSPMSPQLARERLSLPVEKRIVLFVGSFTENKGVLPLIEAFRAARRKRGDLLLILVGHGPLREEMLKLVHIYGLEGCVLFVDRQPQSRLPLWYNSADLLVLPSRSEGRPNVVLEAMACETPVAASDIRGVRELSVKDGAFLLFQPGDAASMEETMLRVLEGSGKGAAGSGLREHLMKSGLTWERCAERYIECYRRVRGENS
jgi:glycosyltransferase involved in cell wall biosynthesis